MAGRCNASQDAQDAWDAGDASLASGRNADGSDAGSVFADVWTSAECDASQDIMSLVRQVRMHRTHETQNIQHLHQDAMPADQMQDPFLLLNLGFGTSFLGNREADRYDGCL